MITTHGLNPLALPVRDPRRSARFYSELFDMEVTSSSPEVAFLKSRGGWDMIALNRSDSPVPSSRGTLHFGFRVDPEQFDAALEAIRERSLKTVSEPGERAIGRYIFIEDPDGYVVEIFECLTPPYA